jgi:hypothetical protein
MAGFREETFLLELMEKTQNRWPDCLRVVFSLEHDRRFIAYRINPAACGQ